MSDQDSLPPPGHQADLHLQRRALRGPVLCPEKEHLPRDFHNLMAVSPGLASPANKAG